MALTAINATASLVNNTAGVSQTLVAALSGTHANDSGPVAPTVNSTLAATTVVSEVSTTSVSGQVTTVTNYADGSSRTTLSEGDSVILSATQHPVS